MAAGAEGDQLMLCSARALIYFNLQVHDNMATSRYRGSGSMTHHPGWQAGTERHSAAFASHTACGLSLVGGAIKLGLSCREGSGSPLTGCEFCIRIVPAQRCRIL